jgi:hypothetical protein
MAPAYYAAAQAYLASLPPEHFMEADAQGYQRKVTLESLDLVAADRRDVHVKNELLVQYRLKGDRKIRQVVPDNMVILHDGPLDVEGSYDIELQPARPFWVLEYVSKHNKRKDYDRNFEIYEKDLKVPYYLMFYPDNEELTLYTLKRGKYVSVKPNKNGRLAIPKLDLEVALLDGWVRFWYKGKLLPLPADLQREVNEARRREEEARKQAEEARQREEEARKQAEEAIGRAEAAEKENQRLREELERLRRG